MQLRKKTLKTLGIIVIVLIIIRICLPFIILHFANKNLASMSGYTGRIKDIDLALFRGAYKIDSIYINKEDTLTKKQTPFFSADIIDLSIEWKALLHGSVVGELTFENPTLLFTKDKVEPDEVRKDSADFKELLDDFMPLQINRFEINNGNLQYKDLNSTPSVDLEMTRTYLLAKNLKNSYDSSILLPATIEGRAHIYEGNLDFKMKLNPLAEYPTFDMNAELKNTNLVKFNEFFQAYANIDVNKGKFGLYTEAAAKDGKFSGYVKPLIQDLDVLGKEDKSDNLFRKIWEGLVGTVAEIFTNPPEDQVATKIQFQGDIKDPNTNLWYMIGNILRNAFIKALEPAIDNEINIGSVDDTVSKK